MTVASHNDLESQIAEWRAYILRRCELHHTDAEELEDHLRNRITELTEAGLYADEAFLIAVKRIGDLDALSKEDFFRVYAVNTVGPFQMIRAFRRVLGVPPLAYLLQFRVNRAQALLREGSPLAPVAYSCGFADQSHLTRAFKRVVGVPPGQYARSVRTTAAQLAGTS